MTRRVCAIILEDGRVQDFEFVGSEPSLEELQQAVGGFIELVPTPTLPGHIMVVDEEGLLKGRPLNQKATLIAFRNIVGPAVVLPNDLLR